MDEYQIASLIYIIASIFGILVLFLALKGFYMILRIFICFFFLSFAMTFFEVKDSLQAPNVVAAAISFTNKDSLKAIDYMSKIQTLFIRLSILYFIYLFFSLSFYLIRSRFFVLLKYFSPLKYVNDNSKSINLSKINNTKSEDQNLGIMNHNFNVKVKPSKTQNKSKFREIEFLSKKEQQILDHIFDSVLDKDLIKERSNEKFSKKR